MFEHEEELHPDLADCLSDDDPEFVNHPLVISTYLPELNAMLNAEYEQKLAGVERARAAGDWETLVDLHQKPYQLDAFLDVADVMDDETYWTVLGRLWVRSESIYDQESEWLRVLTAPRPSRHLLMTADERAALAAMADPIEVFRGFCHDGREVGLSWTTDYERAVRFAKRFAGLTPATFARVARGTVTKGNVLAHFRARGEDELVVALRCVHDVRVERVA